MYSSIEIKRIRLQNISYQEERDWNTILQRSDDATIFHTPEWVRLLVEETGAKSKILIAYYEQEPVGIFPYYIKKASNFKRYARTTMFETPYGGPIAYTDIRNKIINDLIKKHHRFFKIGGSEIILPPTYNIDPFIKNKYSIIPRQTMILDLGINGEELWKTIGSENRRKVRKAEKNGVKIIEVDSSSLKIFREMLAHTYKRLSIGKPANISFYKKLYELLYPKNMIKLVFAIYNSSPIASDFFLCFKGTVIGWQAASYNEYWRLGANSLIQWHIIEESNKLGYKYYDSLHFHDKKGNVNLSLKKFKKSFGAKEKDFYVVRKNFPIHYVYKAARIPRYFKRLWVK